MSHFTKLKTRIAEPDALIKALADMGFKQVEIHETAQNLYGYRGDIRQQRAEVIIRRKHIGKASNDIGFRRREDGTFDVIISDYDRSKYSQEWLNRLTQRYAYHTARAKLEEQGFALIAEDVQEGECIHLVLRRMG
jgi:uncharacterized protein DUF1257